MSRFNFAIVLLLNCSITNVIHWKHLRIFNLCVVNIPKKKTFSSLSPNAHECYHCAYRTRKKLKLKRLQRYNRSKSRKTLISFSMCEIRFVNRNNRNLNIGFYFSEFTAVDAFTKLECHLFYEQTLMWIINALYLIPFTYWNTIVNRIFTFQLNVENFHRYVTHSLSKCPQDTFNSSFSFFDTNKNMKIILDGRKRKKMSGFFIWN